MDRYGQLVRFNVWKILEKIFFRGKVENVYVVNERFVTDDDERAVGTHSTG